MIKREQNIPDAIRLIRSASFSPITNHQLIALYGSASKSLEALPELAGKLIRSFRGISKLER